MKQEIDLHRLRLIIRGAKDFYDHDGVEIKSILEELGHAEYNKMMDSIETALIWLRRIVEDAIDSEAKEKA